jgi:hypothetical protein
LRKTQENSSRDPISKITKAKWTKKKTNNIGKHILPKMTFDWPITSQKTIPNFKPQCNSIFQVSDLQKFKCWVEY